MSNIHLERYVTKSPHTWTKTLSCIAAPLLASRCGNVNLFMVTAIISKLVHKNAFLIPESHTIYDEKGHEIVLNGLPMSTFSDIFVNGSPLLTMGIIEWRSLEGTLDSPMIAENYTSITEYFLKYYFGFSVLFGTIFDGISNLFSNEYNWKAYDVTAQTDLEIKNIEWINDKECKISIYGCEGLSEVTPILQDFFDEM